VENFAFYRESITHFSSILGVTPKQSACDLHPDYLSTRFARGRKLPCRAVQHHHAHIGAVLAEHGVDGPVLGVVLDGAGFGADGTVFGGEIYRADRNGYVRLGRLSHLLLPGGDQAAREPWRMALALLYQGLGQAAFATAARLPALAAVPEKKQQLLAQMLVKKINCPSSSSCGRLFDAVAALTGLCLYSEYEGQAAMLLEACAAQAPCAATPAAYPLSCREQDGLWVIDSASLAGRIVHDLGVETDAGVIARRFHLWLVESLVTVLLALQRQTGLEKVVLSGGCMQNKLLFETLVQRLEEHDCFVLAGELVPMNDGGIALGQAYTGGRTPCV
jgi:hydrogenase maturation protein HypF